MECFYPDKSSYCCLSYYKDVPSTKGRSSSNKFLCPNKDLRQLCSLRLEGIESTKEFFTAIHLQTIYNFSWAHCAAKGNLGNGSIDRNDEDVYFDDESAEVVISSLRLGDDQGSSLFTNSNWFAFQDDQSGGNDLKFNGTSNGSDNSADDEVVVGEIEESSASKTSSNGSSATTNPFVDELIVNNSSGVESMNERTGDLSFFQFEAPEYEDPFEDRPMPEWVAWGEVSADLQVGGSSLNPFEDEGGTTDNNVHLVEASNASISTTSSGGGSLPNGKSSCADSHESDMFDSSERSVAAPSLFEEDVEFVGVEIEGTQKAMEHALKEGIVGEAGPLKRNIIRAKPEESDDGSAGIKKEFNDSNYWSVDQEVVVSE